MSLADRRRQSGLALLMAMLIVLIASTIAISIVYEEKFTIRKTGHTYSMDRASLYAFGLEDFARLILRKDSRETKVDSLTEDWVNGLPAIPIEGGFLTGYLEDEQAKFNLNSLLGPEIIATRFRRLCKNLEVDDRFIPALMDWIDADFDIRYPDGLEDGYENYRVANREMSDVSELLLVKHVTYEIYEKLLPHITVLPATATLNLNTISETVFKSLDDKLDGSQFIEEREDQEFASVADFITRMQIPIDIEGLSVNTNYFRAYGQVLQGDAEFNLTTLIKRDDKGKTAVINRTLGVF